MGFIIWVIGMIIVALICRALRSSFKAVDWIVGLIVLAFFIITWINDGFWMALLAGFLGLIATFFLFGIGGGTQVRKFGYTYTLKCNECDYDHLEIIGHTDYGVVTRCKRCKNVCNHTLNH